MVEKLDTKYLQNRNEYWHFVKRIPNNGGYIRLKTGTKNLQEAQAKRDIFLKDMIIEVDFTEQLNQYKDFKEPATIQVLIRMEPALKSKFDLIKKEMEEHIKMHTEIKTTVSNADVMDYLCNVTWEYYESFLDKEIKDKYIGYFGSK